MKKKDVTKAIKYVLTAQENLRLEIWKEGKLWKFEIEYNFSNNDGRDGFFSNSEYDSSVTLNDAEDRLEELFENHSHYLR